MARFSWTHGRYFDESKVREGVNDDDLPGVGHPTAQLDLHRHTVADHVSVGQYQAVRPDDDAWPDGHRQRLTSERTSEIQTKFIKRQSISTLLFRINGRSRGGVGEGVYPTEDN